MTKKILIVCLGNICRSPLAEGLLLKYAKEKKLDVKIDSAGLESYHVGEAPDTRTQKNALNHGLDISNLRARQFNPGDFEFFDYIFVMDESIYDAVISMAKTKEDEKKVLFMLDVIFPGQKQPVPDPYLGGESGFEEVYQLVNKASLKISEMLLLNKL